MKVKTVELEDEGFIQKESPVCSLFLQTTKTFSRFLIRDQQQNIRLLQEIETEYLANEKSIYLNLRYKDIFLLTLPESFIFIPEEFYDTNNLIHLDQYLLLNPDEKILEHNLTDPQITTRFTVNRSTQQVQGNIGVSSIIPSPNVLITELLSLKTKQEDIISINFYTHEFEMAYVKEKRFMFYNRFPKATADEFNYFLLAVFEQLGIDPANTAFYLSGEISEADENHARIEKYSSHTYFLAATKKHPIQLNSNKANRYHQLLTLSACV